MPENYKVKSVIVCQTSSGKYCASIICEHENQVKQLIPETFLGLDFSMHELLVASDRTAADYPRFFRKAQKKLARECRKLLRCVIGSKNRAKQRISVAKLYDKIANQRKDFLHKQSRQIAVVLSRVNEIFF